MKSNNKIIVTTTQSIDGYEICDYLDIIAAETFYKVSFGKALTQKVLDAWDQMKVFSDNELRGTMGLMQEARTYVKNELVKKALDLGADAVVGIETESSLSGEGIAKATITGTAVKIRPSFSKGDYYAIKVMNYNPDLPIRTQQLELLFQNGMASLSLHLVPKTGEDVNITAVKADIFLDTCLGDTISVPDIYFYNFEKNYDKSFHSSYAPLSISNNIPYALISSSRVILKGYVSDGVFFQASDNDLDFSNPGAPETETLSNAQFWERLEFCNNAAEIYNYLQTLDSNFVHPEVLDIAKSSYNAERIYGNMKADCIVKLRKFYDKNSDNSH